MYILPACQTTNTTLYVSRLSVRDHKWVTSCPIIYHEQQKIRHCKAKGRQLSPLWSVECWYIPPCLCNIEPAEWRWSDLLSYVSTTSICTEHSVLSSTADSGITTATSGWLLTTLVSSKLAWTTGATKIEQNLNHINK